MLNVDTKCVLNIHKLLVFALYCLSNQKCDICTFHSYTHVVDKAKQDLGEETMTLHKQRLPEIKTYTVY